MSAAITAETHADRHGPLSHRQIMQIIIGLMLGMFLASLDQTIVSTAIRTIGDDLHGLSVQAWVTTAYLITSTIATPLYGKLSDIYGRKPFYLFAIAIFIVGSLASAFATSMYMLAVCRAIQGLGAGGLFSLALAITGDILPPRERAKYQGYFLAVFGTSSVLGPVVGGFFAGQSQLLGITGWRWVFLINVPIGLIALFVVGRVLHVPHSPRDHRIDWWGAATITVGLVPLLIVAEQGRGWGWTSPLALGCYAVGLVGLIAFTLIEARMGDEALIPLRFFKEKTFGIVAVVSVILGVGMFGGLAALPLYLQIVKGASPTEAGLLLLPMTVGMMAGSLISGNRITKTGRYKIYPIIGGFAVSAALFSLSFVTASTPFWPTALLMVVFGFGLGFIMQPITLAVQNAASPADIGVATSSSTFFRQAGGTLGTAIFLSVLFSTVGGNITHAATDPATAAASRTAAVQFASDPSALKGVEAVNQAVVCSAPQHPASISCPQTAASPDFLSDTSFLAHLDPRLAKPFLVGFSDSMDTVFLLGALVTMPALILLFFLPELPLRTRSAVASRHAEGESGDGPGPRDGASHLPAPRQAPQDTDLDVVS